MDRFVPTCALAATKGQPGGPVPDRPRGNHLTHLAPVGRGLAAARLSLWSLPIGLAMLGTPLPLFCGQEVTEVSPTPTCAGCAVELEQIVELGDATGEGWVDLTGRIAVADTGIVIANLHADDELRVFSHRGQFLQIVGRSGEGPGEFRAIIDIRVAPDGRIYVLDRNNRRISVFSSTLEFERTIPLPGRPISTGLLPLSDGTFIVNLIIPSAELIGYPLHRVSSTGEVLVTFGTDSPRLRPDRPYDNIRRLAASRSGRTFWSVPFKQYRISQYTIDGTWLRSITMDAPWLERSDDDIAAGAPAPGVVDVQEDPEGRLWVLSRTTDPEWRTAVTPRMTVEGPSVEIDEYYHYFNTIIDVIQPETGELLTRLVWPAYGLKFVAPGVVVSYNDNQPVPKLVLWRLRLVVP